MRGKSTQQLSFGDGFIDPSLYKLDEELQQVDQLLSDRTLIKPFEECFNPTMGRSGTPVDVYLRMMYDLTNYEKSGYQHSFLAFPFFFLYSFPLFAFLNVKPFLED